MQQLPEKINHGFHTYIRDFKLCNAVNKYLETNYKAVYLQENTNVTVDTVKRAMDWSGSNFIAITPSGKHVLFNNSEWASFSVIQPKT